MNLGTKMGRCTSKYVHIYSHPILDLKNFILDAMILVNLSETSWWKQLFDKERNNNLWVELNLINEIWEKMHIFKKKK